MAWRETRASWLRLVFFFLCVGLGVASIIGVQATAYKLLYGENQYKLPGDVL